MKPRNYVLLMVVGAVAVACAPIAPCRAGWVYVGNGLSGGAPPYASDSDSGTGWSWFWSYSSSSASRGADDSGCYAGAELDYYAYVSAWSNGGTSASVSVPDGPRYVYVGAESYYANIQEMGYRYLDYEIDVFGEGTVWIMCYIDEYSMDPNDPNDDAYSWALAYGGTDHGEYGTDYGYGYVEGEAWEFTTGDADWLVGGDAIEDSTPTPIETSGYCYIELDFTIDVVDGPFTKDSVNGPSQFEAAASIVVSVDGGASFSGGTSSSGRSDAATEAYMDAYSIVDVDLYN